MRAGILGALVVLCVLSVLGPLGTYVREQSNTAALQRKVAAAGEEKERLAGAVKRWDDPSFVGAQARDRLHYVLPGETGYVVLDLPDEPDDDSSPTVPVDDRDALAEVGDAPTAGHDDAWYGRLWTSVEAAGQR